MVKEMYRRVQTDRNQKRAAERAASLAVQQDANKARQDAFDKQNADFLDMIRQ